jgi:hypothetical protein
VWNVLDSSRCNKDDNKTVAQTSVSTGYSVFSDTAKNAVSPSFVQKHKTRQTLDFRDF